MPWTRSTPTSATRPVAIRERLMTLVGASAVPPGGEQFVVTSTAILPDHFTPARLNEMIHLFKTAWLALRFEHPSIASTVSADGSSIEYSSPVSRQLQDEWLAKTFIIDDTARTTEQIRTRLRDRASSSVTLAPRARTIMLAMSHWKTDGRACIQLCGRYLDLCNEPLSKLGGKAWGTELDRLVPSLPELAGLTPEPPSLGENPAFDQDALDYLRVGAPDGQKLTAEPTAPSADPLTDHILLSQEKTKALVQACRARGIGFGSAVHAAAALHNLSLADPTWSQKEYRYGVHRDLRSRLPVPWDGIASAGGLMVSTSAATIPSGSDFMAVATILHKHGKYGYTDEKFALDEAKWSRVLEIIASTKSEDRKTPLDLPFSSLGIIDPFFERTKDVMAEHLEMGVQVYSAGAGGWAYTYQGRLNMTVSYNEAYRSRASMRNYLEAVKSTLERELL